jgi:hypothetical protein
MYVSRTTIVKHLVPIVTTLLILPGAAPAQPAKVAMLREITVAEGSVSDIVFLPNGKEFVCVCAQVVLDVEERVRGPIRFVDIEKGVAVRVWAIPAGHGASLLAVSPDGKWLASGKRYHTTKTSDLLL